MKYQLVIYGAPYTSQAPQTALFFAKALLEAGHETGVFFYQQGVRIASDRASVPQDEVSLHHEWAKFAAGHNIELIICVTAALREGIVSQEEAMSQNKSSENIKPPFVLSGLGQMIEGLAMSDRLMVFGS